MAQLIVEMCDSNKEGETANLQEVLQTTSLPQPNIQSQIESPEYIRKQSYIKNFKEYENMYKESQKPEFWGKLARECLDWFTPFTSVLTGTFERGNISWFGDGYLNACYNCLDRHIQNGKGEDVAIIYEGDQPTQIQKLTFNELLDNVCKFANALKRRGIRKGDVVCIYMPMIPEAIMAILACTRIGAVHTVVFAGFSVEALRERIIESKSIAVITVNQSKRGGKVNNLLRIVDMSLLSTLKDEVKSVKTIFVLQNTTQPTTNDSLTLIPERDVDQLTVMEAERPVCPCEPVNAEDPQFILFTSGSTGKPKGIQHTVAGYLLYTMLTTKYVFNLQPNDIYACVADIGWITGHSYIVYGPLLNGNSTFIFESTPTYPDIDRYWDLIERHKITKFYTSPTAIRALMRYGVDPIKKHDLSSLQIVGTVGEPISPEAWKWMYNNIGNNNIYIVDTYWQTETGGHILAALPGSMPMKPGSVSLPFFGIDIVLMSQDGREIKENNVPGLLCIRKPWPGMARTCWQNHTRYKQSYFSLFKGQYFTGDSGYRDTDGYYWIIGRVDDVINVCGHRIGSAEIENAIGTHQGVAESAVVGVPHPIKGQALFAFVILKLNYYTVTNFIQSEIILQVSTEVGAFARPDYICMVTALPKTRSGKIMRRLLRKIACGETEGLLQDIRKRTRKAAIIDQERCENEEKNNIETLDEQNNTTSQPTIANVEDLSTLSNPEIIEELILQVNELFKNSTMNK